MTPLRALLDELAVPRLTGTAHAAQARDRLRRELEARGCVVMEQRFPAAPRFPLRGATRADGVNLIAVRPRTRVTTWLVAHYDSKAQPLSMAWRLVWAVAAGVALAAAAVATGVGAAAWPWWLGALGLAGGFLALNRAADGSPGAVDNATGVLTVLAALDALPAQAGVGALLLDAEELGLVGASALARERGNLLADTTVVNFDGIDDRGPAIAFVHRPGPTVSRLAAALEARAWRWLPVVVDGLALAGASAECVTIMKGDWRTMRVVHTSRDRGDRLTLDGVRATAQRVVSVLTADP